MEQNLIGKGIEIFLVGELFAYYYDDLVFF